MISRATWRRGVLPLLVIAFALQPLPSPAASDSTLAAFAAQLGIRDSAGFIGAVRSIDETGRVPPARFVTKGEAASRGWRPGSDLCSVSPGRAIGGDSFHNAEGRLPGAPARSWREADLDYACGNRGPKRLVWSTDRMKYVTVDHYRSFVKVPD